MNCKTIPLPCLITGGDPMLAEYPRFSKFAQFFINIYVIFVGQLPFFLIGRAILEDLFPSISHFWCYTYSLWCLKHSHLSIPDLSWGLFSWFPVRTIIHGEFDYRGPSDPPRMGHVWWFLDLLLKVLTWVAGLWQIHRTPVKLSDQKSQNKKVYGYIWLPSGNLIHSYWKCP